MQRKHKPYFVALDGEAINGKYVLLGTSLPDRTLENREGIRTDEALEFLVRLGSNRHLRAKSAVFVGFFFAYDIEMLFRDLSDRQKNELFHSQQVEYKGYIIKAIKKKFLSIRKKSDKTYLNRKTGKEQKGNTNGITIYDCAGFFPGMSFIKVCKQILGYNSDELTEGKASRSTFSWEEYNSVKSYNALECQLLVKVMNKVYEMLDREGLNINRYYGSSAVANYALRKWKIGEEMRRTVEEKMTPHIWEALTCAYFGGRIEALKLGTFKNVFAYDINSAYPAEIARLWSNKGIWTYASDFVNEPFSVWHIEFKFPKSTAFGCFPFREKTGAIKYPLQGRGWYWFPEIEYAMKRYPGSVKFIEGYYHLENKLTTLASVIPNLYKKRQQYKAKGDISEYILKITLNALYGKFAQKVGSSDYRNFVWAGYITSATRAKLLRATNGHEKSIIAFATDGIYSKVKLNDLPLSKELGEWSFEKYKKAHIIMSGVYLLTTEDKERKTGERGFKYLIWDKVLADLTAKGKSQIKSQIFVGFNLAFNFPNQYRGKYLTFIPETKTINPGNLDKRKYKVSQIKDWTKDSCNSEPILFCRDSDSAPISTVVDSIPDADLIYQDEIVIPHLLLQGIEENLQLIEL
ncbi:MAG TPA: DNA polymerase [Chlamydiales bacterium]|jgi:hypothetical protein|nr:DNA polymerase [Chlamydiales bacterium]